MAITFDLEKDAKNVAERDLSFARVAYLDWSSALIVLDDRRDYGEVRLQVMGMLDDRLHLAVVTPRGVDLRVISFRKANRREAERYATYRRRSSIAP